MDASNSALLVELDTGEGLRAVYKPVRGARPLHDFDADTLSQREVIVYELSARSGLHCVPLTVWREDLPFGPGSLQLFIEHDDTEAVDIVALAGEPNVEVAGPSVELQPVTAPEGWLVSVQGEDESGAPVALIHRDHPMLRTIAVFDAAINNADRKAGHLLHDSGRWWAIDNGLSLHEQHKLRTVFWGWAGDSLTVEERSWLQFLVGDVLPDVAGQLPGLTAEEWRAASDRVAKVLQVDCMPQPDPRRRSIPWPVF